MSRYRRVTRIGLKSTTLAYLFGAILLIGAVTSGVFTKDARWIGWHFSRLGEGGGVSADIFNLTLVIAAVVVLLLGRSLVKKVERIAVKSKTDLTIGRNIIRWSFVWICISFLGVAIFPFDQFSAIHNLFGYSVLFVLLILSVVIEKYLPMLSKKFHSFSGLVLPVTVVCYTLFAGLRVVTLLEIESVIFVMLYAWLLLFIHELNMICNKV